MNQKGYALYSGFGPTTKGAGFSFTYSSEDIQPHSTTGNISINKYGLSGNGSLSIRDGFVPFAEGDLAGGLGSPGSSAFVAQTFSFHEWNDPSWYKFIQTVE